MMALDPNLAHITNPSSLTFLKYKHSVSKSRDMSRGHFAKNGKLLTKKTIAR